MRISLEELDQVIAEFIAVSLTGERGLVSSRANDGQYCRL